MSSWIKMRGNLWDDPRVARICEITDKGEAEVVGGLYWLWSMADAQSTDGTLAGMSTFTIDRKTGVKGLGDAIKNVGWVTETSDGLRIERFDEHNGASAKRRSLEAKRKGDVRKPSAKCPHSMQTKSGHDAELDKSKIRIDKNISKDIHKVADAPVVFPQSLDCEEFKAAWSSYTAYRKEAKLKALKPMSIKGQLEEMAGWGVERAIQAINTTIAKGWQGVFEPKSGYGTIRPDATPRKADGSIDYYADAVAVFGEESVVKVAAL
jgi:hypothetical protein